MVGNFGYGRSDMQMGDQERLRLERENLAVWRDDKFRDALRNLILYGIGGGDIEIPHCVDGPLIIGNNSQFPQDSLGSGVLQGGSLSDLSQGLCGPSLGLGMGFMDHKGRMGAAVSKAGSQVSNCSDGLNGTAIVDVKR